MDQPSVVFRYFTELSPLQKERIAALAGLYESWNAKINVISRKDMDFFYERHVLHSLAIAKFRQFRAGEKVMDAGTGGGLPAIPLAILFPETLFLAIDSITKKIKVVDAIAAELGLSNLRTINGRVEAVREKVDFVVTRATAPFGDLVRWTSKNIDKEPGNGIIALKGGDLTEELKNFRTAVIYPVSTYFNLPFFESKKIVYWAA